VILVLVDPTVSLLSLDHELVVSESSVHERVDEGSCQVGSSGIDVDGRACEREKG